MHVYLFKFISKYFLIVSIIDVKFFMTFFQVAAFKTSEQREIDQMRKLRLSNMSKSREAGTDSKFCVCRKGASGFMLQCELCRDWYHGKLIR